MRDCTRRWGVVPTAWLVVAACVLAAGRVAAGQGAAVEPSESVEAGAEGGEERQAVRERGLLDLLGPMPSPKSMDFLIWLDAIPSVAAQRCAGGEGGVAHIAQDGRGNEFGGGGAGTAASPLLCRDLHDLAVLVRARIAVGDRTILLRRGSRFEMGPGDAEGGTVTVEADGVVLGAYGQGPKPLLAGYDAGVLTIAGARAVAGRPGVYAFARARPVWWVVTGRPSTGGEGDVLTRVFARDAVFPTVAATLDRMQASPGVDSFCWDAAAGEVYVHIASDRRAAWTSGALGLRAVTKRGDGVVIDADGCRVESLRLEGFGMNADASQAYAIKFRGQERAFCLVRDCEAYFGSHHLIAQLSNRTGDRNTSFVCVDCTAGWCLTDSGGVATVFNSYVYRGDHTYAYVRCRVPYGSLSTEVARARGGSIEAFYGHGGTWVWPHRFAAAVGGEVPTDAPSTNPLWLGSVGQGPMPERADDPSTYRTFRVECTHGGRSGFDRSTPGWAPVGGGVADINCRFLNLRAVGPFGAYGLLGSARTWNSPYLMINGVVEADLSNRPPGEVEALVESRGKVRWLMHQSAFVVRTAELSGGALRFFKPDNLVGNQSEFVNCVVAFSSPAGINEGNSLGVANRPERLRGLAVRNVLMGDVSASVTGVDQALGLVELDQMPDPMSLQPDWTTALRGSGTAAEAPMPWLEFDALRRVRGARWADIGPYASLTCPGDYDRDRDADADDLFSFLTEWFGHSPNAACAWPCSPEMTGDGVVNVDDLFMFLTEWFGGIGGAGDQENGCG